MVHAIVMDSINFILLPQGLFKASLSFIQVSKEQLNFIIEFLVSLGWEKGDEVRVDFLAQFGWGFVVFELSFENVLHHGGGIFSVIEWVLHAKCLIEFVDDFIVVLRAKYLADFISGVVVGECKHDVVQLLWILFASQLQYFFKLLFLSS